ncbi:hypothetical protein ABIN12_002832 [Enterobacter cloacae]
MTTNKPMTGEQLDELMTVAVNMQREAETDCNRASAMFAYAVQVAVLELRKVRDDAEKMSTTSMSITRYWISPNGIACEDESGSFVKYEDYASLEAKYAALAAENSGLKQFPDQIVGFIGKLGSSEIGSETKEKIEAAAKKIKTPTTDAFLAEVRAQGAEMFAAYCGEENSLFVEAKAYYRSLPDAAYEFAAQLRKGVQS